MSSSALNAAGKLATVDVLGEEIRSPDEARAIAGAYRDVLTRDPTTESLDANVSVKLTAPRARARPASSAASSLEDVAATRRRARARSCASTWRTRAAPTRRSRLYRELREAGVDNVGIVLQAALRRTLDDIARLSPTCAPASGSARASTSSRPTIAYQDAETIRRQLRRRVSRRCSTGGSYVAVATHDERLIASRPHARGGTCPRRLRAADAARRARGAGDGAGRRRAPAARLRARSASAGTSTRSAACRRTRRWRRRSRRRRSVVSWANGPERRVARGARGARRLPVSPTAS